MDSTARLILFLVGALLLGLIKAIADGRKRSAERVREHLRTIKAERTASEAAAAEQERERARLNAEIRAWKNEADARAAAEMARAIRERRRRVEEYDWKD